MHICKTCEHICDMDFDGQEQGCCGCAIRAVAETFRAPISDMRATAETANLYCGVCKHRDRVLR